jgi:putative ABC transport system permease protein
MMQGLDRSKLFMDGVLRIAFELLVHDKGKFAVLRVGITVSVFLMIQMTSMFARNLARASATVTNVGAEMRLMDLAVNNVVSSIPMPDYVLDAVRSANRVKHAEPFYPGLLWSSFGTAPIRPSP